MNADEQPNYTVTFTQYNRVVLPADGFAFWVRADILAPSVGFNTGTPFNGTPPYADPPSVAVKATSQKVQGSLHYTTTNLQDETEGFSVNHVVFTSLVEIELLNTTDPKSMFIGEVDGIRFAFSKRTMLFRESGLFHYQGDMLYPSMATQVIDDPAQLNSLLVVSNSLPVWLTLDAYMPMYPSFLVPEDIVPPWCAIHIEPGSTTGIQAAPYIDADTGSHFQLVTERVKLTVYGLRNFNALAFQDYVNGYSLNTEVFGIMNIPVIRDEKSTQAEMNILAQKKSIEYEINYYQASVLAVAQQRITQAFLDPNQVFVETPIQELI